MTCGLISAKDTRAPEWLRQPCNGILFTEANALFPVRETVPHPVSYSVPPAWIFSIACWILTPFAALCVQLGICPEIHRLRSFLCLICDAGWGNGILVQLETSRYRHWTYSWYVCDTCSYGSYIGCGMGNPDGSTADAKWEICRSLPGVWTW